MVWLGYLNGNLNFDENSTIYVIAAGSDNYISDPYQYAGGVAGHITGCVTMPSSSKDVRDLGLPQGMMVHRL